MGVGSYVQRWWSFTNYAFRVRKQDEEMLGKVPEDKERGGTLVTWCCSIIAVIIFAAFSFKCHFCSSTDEIHFFYFFPP